MNNMLKAYFLYVKRKNVKNTNSVKKCTVKKKHFQKHLQLKTTMINFSVGKVGEKN